MVLLDPRERTDLPAVVRVSVAAPYPAVRAGLRAMLNAFPTLELVATGDPDTDVAVYGLDDETDVSVIPPVFLGAPGIIARVRDRQEGPAGYLTQEATADQVHAAVLAVASGLTVMDQGVIAASARRNGRGGGGAGAEAKVLTARELDVLRLIGEGLPNKAIGLQLGISENTVKFHASSILGKLDAASRAEAIAMAVRSGLLPM